jgi:Na+-transporting NADH:ubiquinone oxidoreductase subunit NqrD
MDEKLALNLESSMIDFLVSLLQVLAEENQREIVEFCKQEGLVLLADEVMDCFFFI